MATAGSVPTVVPAKDSMLVPKATKETAFSAIPSAEQAIKVSSPIARRSAHKTGKMTASIATNQMTGRTRATQVFQSVKKKLARNARRRVWATLRGVTSDGTEHYLVTAP